MPPLAHGAPWVCDSTYIIQLRIMSGVALQQCCENHQWHNWRNYKSEEVMRKMLGEE
ncbi:MAG: hypothetical protein HOC79_09380 [Euryarchaeota archaeon]|nr:hypothetical protein [Euryarchaeota archaeon]